jgi:hypothetical protein
MTAPRSGAAESGQDWDNKCDADQVLPEMAWAKPAFTRGQVDKAGQVLIETLGPLYPVDWDIALQSINNWRSSHSYALQSVKMGLVQRARDIDEKVIVAQRLKRLSSIKIKLERNANMKLTQMQDIGGCRAIVRSPRSLDRLVRVYDRLDYSRKFDYITTPKADGYRSVHFVRKYVSNLPQNQVWVGLRIEIQLRTRLQHAWATAVETVDTFSKQRIKTGAGEERWRRFFALMSSALALREGKALVPGTPETEEALTKELRAAVHELRVVPVLNGWTTALRLLPHQAMPGAEAFLLVLNTEHNTLRIVGFTDAEGARASEEYLLAEKEIQQRADAQAVLVSVKSVQGLQAAFPNYFADTGTFITAVQLAIS